LIKIREELEQAPRIENDPHGLYFNFDEGKKG
jgi:hypothetical protein